MLTSINPLGERARQNRWIRTVLAFTIAAIATGGALGALLGWVGALLPGLPSIGAMAGVLIGAGLLDIARVPAPGPRRQVDETWIGAYRDWVYGAAYGAQLGAGFTTHIVTWGTWAVAATMLAVASPALAAGIGAGFGAGRAMSMWTTVRVERPEQLIAYGSRMAALSTPARTTTAFALAVVGVAISLQTGNSTWPI